MCIYIYIRIQTLIRYTFICNCIHVYYISYIAHYFFSNIDVITSWKRWPVDSHPPMLLTDSVAQQLQPHMPRAAMIRCGVGVAVPNFQRPSCKETWRPGTHVYQVNHQKFLFLAVHVGLQGVVIPQVVEVCDGKLIFQSSTSVVTGRTEHVSESESYVWWRTAMDYPAVGALSKTTTLVCIPK